MPVALALLYENLLHPIINQMLNMRHLDSFYVEMLKSCWMYVELLCWIFALNKRGGTKD